MARRKHTVEGWIAVVAVLAITPLVWGGVWEMQAKARDLTGTWLDAFNFLDELDGPTFLFVFVLYAGVLLAAIKGLALWWQSRVEGASLLDLGPQVRFELKPTYLELAYLKGGAKAAVEAALCNLHRLGAVSAYVSRRPGLEAAVASRKLHGLERAVAAACRDGLAAYSVISDRRVVQALADFESVAQSKLRRVGLLAARPTNLTALGAMVMALAFIDGLGAIRLARSVMRGYTNVAFLVVLMAGVVPVVFFMYRPWLTRAGKRYIQQMKGEYQTLARRVQAKMHAWDAPEVLYAVAVYGAGALAGTGYATIHQAMEPPAASTSGGSCSSCGGGGCGGGGCGGGGCGGGGCGGG